MDPQLLSVVYDHGPTLGAVLAGFVWLAKRLDKHEELCHRRELATRESRATVKNELQNLNRRVGDLEREHKS